MSDEDFDSDDGDEDGDGPNYAVMVPIGFVLGLPGFLLLVLALLAGLNLGPFPGILANISARVGFYPVDMVYMIGFVGVSLFLAGLVTTVQGFQKMPPPSKDDEEEEEEE